MVFWGSVDLSAVLSGDSQIRSSYDSTVSSQMELQPSLLESGQEKLWKTPACLPMGTDEQGPSRKGCQGPVESQPSKWPQGEEWELSNTPTRLAWNHVMGLKSICGSGLSVPFLDVTYLHPCSAWSDHCGSQEWTLSIFQPQSYHLPSAYSRFVSVAMTTTPIKAT